MEKRVTIKDVAKLAGCRIWMISNYLNTGKCLPRHQKCWDSERSIVDQAAAPVVMK